MISATLADPPARAEAARDAAMTAHAERADQGAPPPSAERYRALVDAHFDVIWRSLRGLGVLAGSADDAAQHVFLIAHHKLSEMAPGRERSFPLGTALWVAANAPGRGAPATRRGASRRSTPTTGGSPGARWARMLRTTTLHYYNSESLADDIAKPICEMMNGTWTAS
ncbi:hypothetical protein [Sorangium sp. So ce394]|uniref:hypothetical protein n=1 Tax=Sorangium sp. So ce394 TaxID=3133310 RepID=UPI003F5B1238